MGEKDMGKKKQKVLLMNADGARRVMRKRDYMADMGGQLALGVMANLVGQLTYFYTDKSRHGGRRSRNCDDDR